MRFPHLFTGAVLAAALTGAGGAPALAGVLISIDKSAQEMTVAVDGVARHHWPVSTGRSGYRTPAGTFQPFRLEEDHFSKEWDDAPMPHSIFFTREGHAIHGSFETKKLGSPASAGCVRLAPEHAKKLFALVQEVGLKKSKVEIGGTEPAPPPAVAKRGAPRDAPPARSAARADTEGRREAREPYDPYLQRLPPDAYAEHRQRRLAEEEEWIAPPTYQRRPAYVDPRYPYYAPRPYAPRGGYYYGGRW